MLLQSHSRGRPSGRPLPRLQIRASATHHTPMTIDRPDMINTDPHSGPPRINSARRIGVRPGTEVVHALATTGTRPISWTVQGLPGDITVDAEGILRGHAPPSAGTFEILVRASNTHGSSEAVLELHVGDTLALTPPMGWNSWNVYAHTIDAATVLRTAHAMVDTGMRDLGYQYINIDDHWHASQRGPDGTPAANPDTFPDGIGPVADEVHALGLKIGIYSDAAEKTCGNCFGGLGYETIDARTYATWGIDYLKYDYCHAPRDATTASKRYAVMGEALSGCGRSIVYSVCEWGGRRPWEWAPDTGAALWRTTWDIFDTFGGGRLGVRGIARRNLTLAAHAGPGHWNDPDMLLVGNRGKGRSTGALRAPFRGDWRPTLWSFRGLNDIEAHTHMTLWAMMAAPLFASHDIANSDPLRSGPSHEPRGPCYRPGPTRSPSSRCRREP